MVARRARRRGAALVAGAALASLLGVLPTPSWAAPASLVHCLGVGTEPALPVAHPDDAVGVAQYRYTFVDRSRGTPALGARKAADCRTLPTVVRYPTGAAAAPMVLLIHGADGDPADLATLADTWAAAGYVVVQPRFPVNRKDGGGKALGTDLVHQTSDARFVLDEVLDRSAATAAGPLQGRIDPRHIGVAGMSLGGQTVYGLISHTCCRDGRITGAVVMAGVHDSFPRGHYGHQSMPVLLVQGDADIGYHHSRDTYPQLAPPKWFVTLKGERHSPPFEVPRNSAAAGIVDATTVAFWNLALRNDASGSSRIVSVVRDSGGKATLQEDLGN